MFFSVTRKEPKESFRLEIPGSPKPGVVFHGPEPMTSPQSLPAAGRGRGEVGTWAR